MIFIFTQTHTATICPAHWLNRFTAPAATLLGAPLLRGAGGQSGQRRKARLASERARAHATTRRAAHRARCAKRNTLLGQPHVCLHSWPRNQTVDQLRCCCCCCCRVACHSHRRAPQPPAARRVDACLCVSLPFSGRAANSHARRRRTPRQPQSFRVDNATTTFESIETQKAIGKSIEQRKKKSIFDFERRTKLNSQEKKEINFISIFFLISFVFSIKNQKTIPSLQSKTFTDLRPSTFWRASLLSKARLPKASHGRQKETKWLFEKNHWKKINSLYFSLNQNF
jgi:hypothetical protein